MSRARRLALTPLLLAAAANAQCDWNLGQDFALPGMRGNILAQTLWDPDGAGPMPLSLVVGGEGITLAGNTPTSNIVMYDGTDWLPLGPGVGGGRVNALTVFNNELIAAGTFTTAGGQPASRIARFNGATWSPLGTGLNATANALAVYNGALYAAGEFSSAGGSGVNRIARWNGSGWTPLGVGLSGPSDSPQTMAVFNGSLYVGGTITSAGGLPASNLAVWNGSAWVQVPGANGRINALAVRDNGVALPFLIAAGNFGTIGGAPAVRIASMNTLGAWSAFGGGLALEVTGLAVRNIGISSYELIAMVADTSIPTPTLAWRWASGAWNALGPVPANPTPVACKAMTYFNGRYHMGRYATGATFSVSPASAAWDGTDWAPVGRGIAGTVSAMLPFNGDLIVGGDFKYAANTRLNHIGRWNGTAWTAMQTGMTAPVRALQVLNGQLYAAGEFTVAGSVISNNVARWNGTAWEAAGLQTAVPSINALTVHNAELYAAGRGASGFYVARRTGSVWSNMSAGLPGSSIFDSVRTLTSYNGALYAGTDYPIQYSSGPSSVARYDAPLGTWVRIQPDFGAGNSHAVHTFFQENSQLYVGGRTLWYSNNLQQSYGLASVGQWSFTALPTFSHVNTNASVATLTSYAGDLYATGDFDRINGQVGENFARRTAGVWAPVGNGLPIHTSVATVYAGDLYIAGSLSAAGGNPAWAWARWRCPATCYANCDGSTAAPILNVQDFACFLNAFAAASSYANCDNSTAAPTLNVQDFACFLNAFAAGCS